MTRKAAHNTGLAKVADQCSEDTLVINQSLVLRINICGENRHLRQARKRCGQWWTTRQRKCVDNLMSLILTYENLFIDCFRSL
jgi:hypothetical protein